MSEQPRDGHESRSTGWLGRDPGALGSGWVFGAWWVMLFFGTFFVACPWAGFHAVLLGCAGLLVWLCPPAVSLPRLWWLLAAAFVLAGAAVFLPAGWFALPAWRRQLEALGVETGPLVAIQARQAAEVFAMFVIMCFSGLWLAGHRPSPRQLRRWALAFTLGVAGYAVISKVMQTSPAAGQTGGEQHFGFFPNRNHTATYLAMGALCGLGNVLQAIRDKRFPAMGVALAATGVCLWAVALWSVSRAGVLLVAIGALLWLSLLGRRYLGRHGLWALGLIGLTVVGLFFIVDSGVKERLTRTVEKANTVMAPADAATPGEGKPALESTRDLDFRIPTALDTLGLIRDFKWTGIGAGQYFYVFPQYRKLTAVANDSDSFHPESDWLWMAAEVGIPATLALALLILLAAWKSLAGLRCGRDRALRSACLVAALLVPIHGLIDVPGHRITLAWCALWLFALSLPAPAADAPTRSRPPASPFRLAALALLAAAAFLMRAQWWGGPQPAAVAGPIASAKAMSLYHADQALQRAAEAGGTPPPAPPGGDLLEQALEQLDQAARLVPLDRRVRYLQGFIGLHFEDLDAKSTQAFAIERSLDPTWVHAPLRQARAWSRTNPNQTARLWQEALLRAEWMDRHHPGSPRSRNRILAEIRRSAQGRPELEALVEKLVHSGEL